MKLWLNNSLGFCDDPHCGAVGISSVGMCDLVSFLNYEHKMTDFQTSEAKWI
jgi:hypothetical protein